MTPTDCGGDAPSADSGRRAGLLLGWPRRSVGTVLALLLGLAFTLLPARAQTVSWTGLGGTGAWATAANWSSDPALPLTTDVAGFDANAANGQYAITLGADRTLAGLVFASTGANTFTFDSANILTVGASGIVNNYAGTQTFDGLVVANATSTWNAASGNLAFDSVRLSANLTASGTAQSIATTLTNFNGNRTFTNNTSGGVTIADVALSDNNTGRTFTVSGTGATTITGTVSNGGTGAGNLTKAGTGTLTLSSANTHSGNTSVTAGTLVAADDAAFGTGTLVLGGGTLQGSGGARTFANAVTLSGSTTLAGSSDLTFDGTLTQTTSRTLTVNNTGLTTLSDIALSNSVTNRTLTLSGTGQTVVSGVISDGLSSASGLTKSGTGTLTLSSANTHSGTTSITAGTVIAANDASFGDGALALGTATLQGSGGARTFANTGTITGNTTFAGSSDLTFTGALTLTGSRTLTFTNTGLTTFGALALSNSATVRTLTLAGAGEVLLDGIISNGVAATGNVTKSGAGTVTFSAANTYSGTTTLSAGTTIVADDAAFGTSTVSLGAITLRGDGSTRTLTNTINLTGNATIGGSSAVNLNGNLTLTANRTFTLTNTAATTLGGTVALSNSATSRTLTVAGAGNLTIDGTITNGLSTGSNLTKTGTGTLTLNGVNTYAGTTTLNGGTTIISAETGLGANPVSLAATRLSFGGGTLRTTATFAIDDPNRGLTVNGGGGTLSPDASTTLTVQNAIAGTGKLNVDGAGSVILAGTAANTFSGGLDVKQGTVGLAKTAGLNATGTGAVTVGDGLGAAASAVLRLDADQQISNTSAVTIHSDGRFEVAGFTETIGSLAGTGAVDLGGGVLTVGGTSSTTFDGTLAGTGEFIKSGTGTLTFGSSLTFGGKVTLAGGTLRLSGDTYNFDELVISGTTVLDFAGNTRLTVGTFTVLGGASLSVLNWTEAVDFFIATSFTGATYDVLGSAPVNQITFTGFAAADTRWSAYDDQVTPVPEPAAWGALLLAAATTLAARHRFLRPKSRDPRMNKKRHE